CHARQTKRPAHQSDRPTARPLQSYLMNQGALCSTLQKFFEVKVNHDVVARGNVSLRVGHRLMGGASRSEAVTVLGKCPVPTLLENLQQGLLDQSVDDARHAELSDPAVRLGYFDPLDRLRLVGSLEQLKPDARPVFALGCSAAPLRKRIR